MRLARGFRGEEERSGSISQELDHMAAQIRGGWKVEHNADGGHTDVTAETATIDGETQVGGPLYLSADGVITPPQIVANQNNYDPKHLADALTLRLNTDASRDLTGLKVADHRRPRRLRILNVGGNDLVLKHNSASSSAFNRISCPDATDVTLDSGDACDLEYDTITKLWRVVAFGAVGGGGSANAFGTIAVSGQSDVVADAVNDTLTLVAGSNVTLTTTPGSDSVTIASSGVGSVGDLLDWVFVRKPADESVTSSTTLQNDDDLLFAIGATEVWAFTFTLFATGAAGAGDIKIALTGPASVAGYYAAIGVATTADPSGGNLLGSNASSNFATATGFARGLSASTALITVRGIAIGGGTAGNIQLQWAQNTSDATAVTVLEHSYLEAQRYV